MASRCLQVGVITSLAYNSQDSSSSVAFFFSCACLHALGYCRDRSHHLPTRSRSRSRVLRPSDPLTAVLQTPFLGLLADLENLSCVAFHRVTISGTWKVLLVWAAASSLRRFPPSTCTPFSRSFCCWVAPRLRPPSTIRWGNVPSVALGSGPAHRACVAPGEAGAAHLLPIAAVLPASSSIAIRVIPCKCLFLSFCFYFLFFFFLFWLRKRKVCVTVFTYSHNHWLTRRTKTESRLQGPAQRTFHGIILGVFLMVSTDSS